MASSTLIDQSHRNVKPIDFAPTITHQHEHLRARAPTAVCLAGEARTIVRANVRSQIYSNLVAAVDADLFLVLSPKWSNREKVQADETRQADVQPKPFSLTTRKLAELRHALRPVSTVVAKDEDMLDVISRFDSTIVSADEQRAIRHCVRLQPFPSRIEDGDGEPWHRTNFQTGPCAPQLSLALRYRTCLGLIALAEAKRGGERYTWVVRSRPDVGLPCALPLSVLRSASARNAVIFQDDYIALMPRAAADVSLRQVPLARQLNASECFGATLRALPDELTRDEGGRTYWHVMERCNPCMTSLAGWQVAIDFSVRVHVETPRQTHVQPVALPVREEHRDLSTFYAQEVGAKLYGANCSSEGGSRGASFWYKPADRNWGSHLDPRTCFGRTVSRGEVEQLLSRE